MNECFNFAIDSNLYLHLNDSMTESKKEEIEDIYFFKVNTKYISSSELKTSNFHECVARVKIKMFSNHEMCEINRIHHGWSVEIGKSQPEGPPVPVGNEARRVSHRNGGPEGWDFPFSTDHP